MAIPKSRTITVTSVKGGTGKSTMVLNLAGIYALNKKKTLIIDLDLYSSAISTMLNVTSNDTLYGLMDDINNTRYEHFEDYIIKYNDYIDVLQAPQDPRYANKIETNFMSLILSKATMRYDVVLIDTNHFMNDINLTAFDNSDVILYVITNDAMDLKNMKTMVSIFKDMDKTNYRILLNSSIFRGRKPYTESEIKTFIKHRVDYDMREFYIKNIDKYVDDGEILTLNKGIRSANRRAMSDFSFIANDLLTDKKEG